MEPKGDVKGFLLLLPGLGENARSVFHKTSLPALLSEQGALTIIPELEKALVAEDFIIVALNKILQEQHSKYGSAKPWLIIGGFSRGGAIAVRYAEYLLSLDSNNNLKGIFAIDPALDLKRLYKSSVNKINYDCSRLIKKEGSFIKNYLDKLLKGPPAIQPDNYLKYSGYSADREDGGNASYLKHIAIRLFSEPDLNYVRKTYCDKLQEDDLNAFDLEKLNKFLLQTGKTQCEYITTKGKGFHSWNILDAEDCAKWIAKITNQQL